ncbi:MAG: type II 3-dehydroquinate dehydratase [Pseudomonadota bacterium]
MARFRVLNGPNLNLLGTREPEVYGHATLAEIDNRLLAQASAAGHELDCLQSNAEAQLIEWIHEVPALSIRGLVINPGAFTHTSIALRDALLGVAVPFIEVHLSNVHARESFRQHSYLSDVALGVITGLGAEGYGFALSKLMEDSA